MKFRWLKINFDRPFDIGLSMYDVLKITSNIEVFPKNVFETLPDFFDVSEQGNKILAQGGTITGFSLTPNGIEVEGVIPNEKRPKD